MQTFARCLPHHWARKMSVGCLMSHRVFPQSKNRIGWCKSRPSSLMSHSNVLKTFGTYKGSNTKGGSSLHHGNSAAVSAGYGSVVRDILHQAMAVECYGCMVKHPSQMQHHCLFLSGEACIRYCLDWFILLVDWVKMKKEFWNHITLDPMEWPSLFWDDEWFQNLWSD